MTKTSDKMLTIAEPCDFLKNNTIDGLLDCWLGERPEVKGESDREISNLDNGDCIFIKQSTHKESPFVHIHTDGKRWVALLEDTEVWEAQPKRVQELKEKARELWNSNNNPSPYNPYRNEEAAKAWNKARNMNIVELVKSTPTHIKQEFARYNACVKKGVNNREPNEVKFWRFVGTTVKSTLLALEYVRRFNLNLYGYGCGAPFDKAKNEMTTLNIW